MKEAVHWNADTCVRTGTLCGDRAVRGGRCHPAFRAGGATFPPSNCDPTREDITATAGGDVLEARLLPA